MVVGVLIRSLFLATVMITAEFARIVVATTVARQTNLVAYWKNCVELFVVLVVLTSKKLNYCT